MASCAGILVVTGGAQRRHRQGRQLLRQVHRTGAGKTDGQCHELRRVLLAPRQSPQLGAPFVDGCAGKRKLCKGALHVIEHTLQQRLEGAR